MDRAGFTAVELIVVVIVIGILASAGIAKYQGYTGIARKNACISNQEQIAAAVRMAENEHGPLAAGTVIRFRFNGVLDDTHLTPVLSGTAVNYRVWAGTVPRSWGQTWTGSANAENDTVLAKSQEVRLFRCPEDTHTLGNQYLSISGSTGLEAASPADPNTYTFAKTVTLTRGTGPADDPLEAYNWITQAVEWRNSSFCFCRRWGRRDPNAAGLSPALLNGTATDSDNIPGRERHLAHSPFSPTSP